MNFNSNTRIIGRIWLSSGKFVFVYAPLILTLIVPAVSQAGILSFFTDLFSGQSVSAQSEPIIENNSQNMPLLEPAINLDPFVDNCADPLVVDGKGALLPPSGLSIDASCAVDNSGGSISTYIVRGGDTLASVAKMFNVSGNTILWYNGLAKNSVLKVGQTLYILPITGFMYTVVSGDTLSIIAKNHKGNVNEIASYNNMAVTDKLTPGDQIMIPNGEASYSTAGSGVTSGKLYEPLLVNVSTLPNYDGYYVQPFSVGHKTQGLHGHNAVDYGMPVGSSIYAAAAGTVIVSKSYGYNGGYGKYVVIQHNNGTQTVYGHFSQPVVSVGQIVAQGQLIGYSGNTGNSTGPHLHFEIRGARNPF